MLTLSRTTHLSLITPHRSARRGFSVVEVLVALMLVSVGILGMAGSSAIMLRVIGDAQRERVAGRLAADRIAMLASSGCGAAIGGSSATADGAKRERWRVNRSDAVPEAVDSVWWSSGAGERVFVLASALPC